MYDKSPDEKKTGQLLLQKGLIDEDQLQEALSIQAGQRTYKPLGEILRELGFVSKRTLHDVLLRYRKQIPLGELLVKMGVISNNQLVQALRVQVHSTKRLGQILAEKGFVTRSSLSDALCMQLGITVVDSTTSVTDKELLSKVNVAFLRKRRVVPLRFTKNHGALAVIMEDPMDRETISDLEKIFKTDIEPVFLGGGKIDHLLDGVFDVWYQAQ